MKQPTYDEVIDSLVDLTMVLTSANCWKRLTDSETQKDLAENQIAYCERAITVFKNLFLSSNIKKLETPDCESRV